MRPDFDEDKDIKIMGQYNNNDKEDTVQAEHEYHLQHGNIEKARQFGAIMADEVMAWEGDQDNIDLLLNEQFLYVFAATVAFDCFTPSRITAVTALSAFYDRIKQSSPEFYTTISSSPAFSFYYLCLRNRSDLGKCVGQTFAMLCGCGEDKNLIERGKRLYSDFLVSAQGKSSQLKFA